MINSALISAQNRQRLYWTNIGLEPQGLFGDLETIINQPKDKYILLKDILQKDIDEKYFINVENNKRLQETLFKNKLDGMCLIDSYNQTIHVNKSITILTGVSRSNHTHIYNPIVHNTMPRSTFTGLAGSGPLSRNDGKTYCLDTGQTNAIEILGGDFRYDEGYRWRDGGKTGTLCTNGESFAKINSQIRRLTPIECERLQTVKDNYTAHVSDSQRYRMLGNGWTVDVIVHILNYIK